MNAAGYSWWEKCQITTNLSLSQAKVLRSGLIVIYD